MTSKNVYPRPQLERENWTNLNGNWEFCFDDLDRGLVEKWYQAGSPAFDQVIEVPFVYQAQASGIGIRDVHNIVWYRRKMDCQTGASQRVLLHFGAVDYRAQVYVNGTFVGEHEGGHTSFSFDVTDYLDPSGRQEVVLRVEDPHEDEEIPRGKQFWEAESRGIWYTNSTGVWQTVWLETVAETYIENLYHHIHFDDGKVEMEVRVKGCLTQTEELEYHVLFADQVIVSGSKKLLKNKLTIDVDVIQGNIFSTNFHDDGRSWTPENPQLFSVELKLKRDSQELDKVQSYFGFRKIHTENGMVYLNNKPYYQKLLLDQGYWPDGLLTAPSDDDFVKDIELSKEMGFNGCRKHQKVEDPRFLYWADVLGFLVWGECAAPPMFTDKSVHRLMNEWKEIIDRDYNHPSIVTWVPINESWGVPNISFNREEQHFSQAIYHYLHTLDKTRPVISNDGWAATETDIVAIHNYMHGQADESKKYAYFKDTLARAENLIGNPSTSWPIFAKGFGYKGQPILLTEFGGIAYPVSDEKGWGYTTVHSEEEFLTDYKRIMDAVYDSEALWGYCYTQITDVEQEINGLLTYDRKSKCPLSLIKEINEGYHIPNVNRR